MTVGQLSLLARPTSPKHRNYNAPQILLATALFALAIAVRYPGIHIVSEDFHFYLQVWSRFITQHGGFSALKYNFADYNVPYLYILTFCSWLDAHTPINLLTSVKLISAGFDAVLAFFVFKIVALRGHGWQPPLLAALAVLLLPSVVMNGSYWAQCDSIYAAFAVAGLYYLLRDRPWVSMLMFGLSFAFKLQAIFILPVVVMLLLARKLPWRTLGLIPVVYILLAVPAWILGRPFKSLLLIYFHQTQESTSLTYNAPTIYAFLQPMTHVEIVRYGGVLLAAAAFLLLFFVMFMRQLTLDRERIVLLATVCVILAPFLLPSMHERYFYLADVLSVVVVFWRPRHLWYVPLLVQFTSLMTYQNYLFSVREGIDLRILALAIAAALAVTTAALLQKRDSVNIGHGGGSPTFNSYHRDGKRSDYQSFMPQIRSILTRTAR